MYLLQYRNVLYAKVVVRHNMSYWRFLPNIITSARFAAVPLLVVWLLDEQYHNALLLFLLMGLSDALDGYLANSFDWKTTLGAHLDPAADKFMLICAYIVLGVLHLLPHWLVFIVILRDVALLAGALSYVFVTRTLEIQPTLISKLNTVVQIILVFVVIYNQINSVPTLLIQLLIGLTVLTTVASGLDYLIGEISRRSERHTN